MIAAREDPYLWAALAALLAGLALGQALRWLASPRGPGKAGRRRAGRSARALAFLALALLPATGLLVFPPKAALLEPLLPWSALAAFALGVLAGTWPRAAGAPIASLCLAAFLLLRSGLGGWIAFRGPREVATLLPYELAKGGKPSFRGDLELAERDSVPVAQEVSLDSGAAALAVESLEFEGPIGLAAYLAREGRSFYRVVALVGESGSRLDFPPASALLDRLAALDAGAGLSPGGPPDSAEALRGMLSRRRSTSDLARLELLEPARFMLDSAIAPLVLSEP